MRGIEEPRRQTHLQFCSKYPNRLRDITPMANEGEYKTPAIKTKVSIQAGSLSD